MPICPHAASCRSCPHLEIEGDASLRRKRQRVAEALNSFCNTMDVAVAPCIPAPSPTGHRTRVKLPLARDPEGGRVRIGLFAPGTHDVIDIPACIVIAPAAAAVIETLRRLLQPFVPPLTHVDVRVSRATGDASVVLVTGGAIPDERGLEALASDIVARHPEVRGIGLRVGAEGPTPRALAGRTKTLCGDLRIVEELAGRRFAVSSGSFFQADPAAAEALHGVVRGFLAPIAPFGTLVDLYAGVGAFGIALADLAHRVVAVESVPEAVADAVASAQLSGVAIEAQPVSADRFADDLRALRPDGVVVDPPRRGLDAKTIEALGLCGARRIAYASCDPQTLARDLAALAPFDLVCREAVPVDLFALSDEVETAASLVREPGAYEPQILWRGEDLVVVEKPWILPTTPQGEGAPSLTSLVRRLLGSDAWSPTHRLDAGTSGPVLFGRGPALGRMGASFQRGEVHKEYLALVRGVPRAKGKVATRAPAELGGGEERTRFARERVVGGYGLVRAFPETGRRHQIRRHLLRIGHPILGDSRYGDPRANRWLAERAALSRLFLHLERLSFDSPCGNRVEIDSPLPPELALVLERIGRLRRGR